MYFDQRKCSRGAISTPWFFSNIPQTTTQQCATLSEPVSILLSPAQLRNAALLRLPPTTKRCPCRLPNYATLPSCACPQLRNAAPVACPTTQRCPLSPAQLRNAAAPCRLPNFGLVFSRLQNNLPTKRYNSASSLSLLLLLSTIVLFVGRITRVWRTLAADVYDGCSVRPSRVCAATASPITEDAGEKKRQQQQQQRQQQRKFISQMLDITWRSR